MEMIALLASLGCSPSLQSTNAFDVAVNATANNPREVRGRYSPLLQLDDQGKIDNGYGIACVTFGSSSPAAFVIIIRRRRRHGMKVVADVFLSAYGMFSK